jgi:threonine/homoserine/homoserine lactone efflux protein
MSLLPPPRDLLLFVTAAALLLATPGPAVLYIVTRSVDQGVRAGLASSSGIATGGLVHVFAAVAGLSALLASSAAAYSVVKYAGAVYLVFLGIRKLREKTASPEEVAERPPTSLWRIYSQGVVVQILNPKSAMFFLAFLPQFASPARGSVPLQLFALGMLFTVMGLFSDSTWALTSAPAAAWLKRSRRFLRHQKTVSGTVYIGLGLATAVSGSRHS